MTLQFVVVVVVVGVYRMVICLAISLLVLDPLPRRPAAAPAFFSKSFQNLRLSSAAGTMLGSCFGRSETMDGKR